MVRPVRVLLGQEHVSYPYSFNTTDEIPDTLSDTLASVMSPLYTQSMSYVPMVPLHAELLGDDVRNTATDLGLKISSNVWLFCEVGSETLTEATAVVSIVFQYSSLDIQRTLHTHDIYNSDDKYLVLVLNV